MLQTPGQRETEGLHVEQGHEKVTLQSWVEEFRPGQWDLLGASEEVAEYWEMGHLSEQRDPIPVGLKP